MDLAFADHMANDVPVFKNNPVGELFGIEDRFGSQPGLIDIDG